MKIIDLRFLLDKKLGGPIRMALTVALAVASWVTVIAGAIDWQAGLTASLPAILQALTHATPIGDVPPKEG